MQNQDSDDLSKRRTFAIISHPDAGKTTITEKLLLFGGAIQLAGTVKGRKSSRHATSDWMELEKQRGISVTTSVMQFPYQGRVVNLLDTPGHADFSEDTYRTLTAVDGALMVIDAVKGVEPRTIKLMQICRMRNTPIITFINKLDRDSKDPLEILDEIEEILNINCSPMTWPIGGGKHFKGVYNLKLDQVQLYKEDKIIKCLNSQEFTDILGDIEEDFHDSLALVQGVYEPFNLDEYLLGKQTPVFFGSALNNFGVKELLDAFVEISPAPQPRKTLTRDVLPAENKFTGFVFKIQANMDPQHRDRIAFLRICSGSYTRGMKMYHARIKKNVQIANALTFMAGDREQVDQAFAGDIIGLHNHGSIQIGDVFTQGEDLKFIGIPNFAPELFRLVRAKDPLKAKALHKGLVQLSEEGATQVFKPIGDNRIILGAIGVLQFDVVAHRLHYEYNVDCVYDSVQLATIRWITCDNPKILEEFKNKMQVQIAVDGGGHLVYLVPTMVNLNLSIERWPEIEFSETREY